MAKHSTTEIHLDVEPGQRRAATPDEGTPFRVAILGDFTGRASRGICETGAKLAARKPILVDRDNFDEILTRLAVNIRLPLADGIELGLSFTDIDDFRPEALFERVELFRSLRETRARLANPDTFAEGAAELGVTSAPPQAPPESKGVPDSILKRSHVSEEQGNLLDQIVGATGGEKLARPARRLDALRQYVQQLAETHLVPGPDPRQSDLLARVDRASSEAMRKLLHHPSFQALEAAWRGLFLLVRRVETSSTLKVYLIDVSKDEIAADLGSAADLRQTGTYKLLVEQTVETAGAEPWSVLAGNYSFDPNHEDILLLARLATIAQAARAPFLGAAGTRVLGFSSFGEMPEARNWSGPSEPEAWKELRSLPQAAYVGLALPRVLLRLPYGAKTDTVDRFDFEEMQSPPMHGDYLWGNPAFACALLLAQSFSHAEWDMRPGMNQEVDGLPLHVFKQDGESVAKPCVEALLTEPAVERMLGLGLMPLVSPVGRDLLRLVRFQSIAEPPTALAGPWASD